jgi:hypothetical protein
MITIMKKIEDYQPFIIKYNNYTMSREEIGAEIFKEILKNKSARNRVNSYFRESVGYNSLIDDIPENDVCFPRSTAPVTSNVNKSNTLLLPPHTNVVLSDGIEKANFIMRDNGLFNKAGVHLGAYWYWNDAVYEIPECYKDDFNYVIYEGKRIYEFQLFESSRPYHDLELDSHSGNIFRSHKYDYGLDKLIHNHTGRCASITSSSLSSISQISCSTT